MTTTARMGRDAENKVKAELEAAGWFVTRAAGSKGKADLVAIRHHESKHLPLPIVYGVQVKRSGWPGPAERAEMATLYGYGVRPICARLVKDGRRLVVEWRPVNQDGSMGEPWRGVP